MGMVFKNIEYMNEGCFENLSGRSVPKSIERAPVHIQREQKRFRFMYSRQFVDNRNYDDVLRTA